MNVWEEREAVNAGVTDYVVKPFDQDTLKMSLSEHCQSKGLGIHSTIYLCRHVMNSDVVTIKADATIADAVCYAASARQQWTARGRR